MSEHLSDPQVCLPEGLRIGWVRIGSRRSEREKSGATARAKALREEGGFRPPEAQMRIL